MEHIFYLGANLYQIGFFKAITIYIYIFFFYILVYRSAFSMTMVEAGRGEPDLGRVFFGVTIGVSVALTLFVFLKKYGRLNFEIL